MHLVRTFARCSLELPTLMAIDTTIEFKVVSMDSLTSFMNEEVSVHGEIKFLASSGV